MIALALSLLPWLLSVRGVVTGAIKFFTTPLGQLVAVALLIAGAWVAGDIHGHRKEHAKCVASQHAADAAAKARDAAQTEIAGEDDAARLKRLEDQRLKDKETIDAYEKIIANSKSAACILDAP